MKFHLFLTGKNSETELVIFSSFAAIAGTTRSPEDTSGFERTRYTGFTKCKENATTVYSNSQGKKSLSPEPYDQNH